MIHRFPWYDSDWLHVYLIVKDFIANNHPEKLNDFVHTFDVFRTDPDFRVTKLADVFNESTHAQLKAITKGVSFSTALDHELRDFGRFVVRGEPFADDLQCKVADIVSDVVGEPVEPCYNFLSLYWEMGVCKVHMDAPFAKWTLDYCIEQSDEWPIYLSKVVPWPERWAYSGDDWEDVIKQDPANRFEPHCMQEGNALVFSGSSQWHYREPMERVHQSNFCNLIFFHFIPAGTSELTVPANWKELFGLPDIAGLENPTEYPL